MIPEGTATTTRGAIGYGNGLLNEMAKHQLMISNPQIHRNRHRTNRHNVTGSPSASLADYRQHIGGSGLNGHHKGSRGINTLIPDIHQRVGCPEIDSNIVEKRPLS